MKMDGNTVKVIKCKGEGQGSCKMCNDNGIWNRSWMCFLYKIEGYEGIYCSECVKKIKALHQSGSTGNKTAAQTCRTR